MSKIEEALEKARKQQKNVLGKSATPGGTQLVPAGASDEDEEIDQHINQSQNLARMVEPWRRSRTELANSRIIYPDMEDGPTINAFRELRTKILQMTKGKNCTILVTSPAQDSGCSFVALNLAVAFSFDETKTALLMDCHFADPAHHELVTTGHDKGLTDYLDTDGLHVEQIIHSIGIQRLRVIPVGGRREGGTEYFTTVKLKRLLKSIRERYPDRYIMIDGPPINHSADARILADVCDYAVLVVPYGKATESQILAASRAIGAHKLLGVIFNDEPQLPKASWFRKVAKQFNQSLTKKSA